MRGPIMGKQSARRERLAEIETAARRLAWSGEFLTWRGVNNCLLELGYTDAAALFANPWTRSEIERICTTAYARQAGGPDSFKNPESLMLTLYSP
jgi:hypothetical protein